MILSLTFEEACALLGVVTPYWEAQLAPNQVEHLPHSPYRPEYAWLFTLERLIARKLEPELSPYRQQLIGAKGIISEALSNAYCHGHARDGAKQIQIQVFRNSRGVLLRIKDQGPGFPVEDTVQKCLRGHRHFTNAGNGMRRMAKHPDLAAFYDDKGSAFHLLYAAAGGHTLITYRYTDPMA